MTRIEILFEHNADSREKQKPHRAVTIDNLKTKQVQQLRPPPAGPSWKENMKSKVQVTVTWSEKFVALTTDIGRQWVLRSNDTENFLLRNKNVVAALTDALLQNTFANWFENTEACKVRFTLIAEDVKES